MAVKHKKPLSVEVNGRTKKYSVDRVYKAAYTLLKKEGYKWTHYPSVDAMAIAAKERWPELSSMSNKDAVLLIGTQQLTRQYTT